MGLKTISLDGETFQRLDFSAHARSISHTYFIREIIDNILLDDMRLGKAVKKSRREIVEGECSFEEEAEQDARNLLQEIDEL